MENKSHALAAGLFVVLASALVIALAAWLTRDNGTYIMYELSTREGVSGLQPQAAVRYKGVSVGKVTHIGFDSQVSGNVLIRIAVDDDAPITPTTFAVLGYQGVTGLAYVLLDDAGKPHDPLPPGPSGLPRLPLQPSPFAQLTEQGPEILGQVQEATVRINRVLGDDNQKHFAQALANIGKAAASLDALAQRLDRSVGERLDPALAALPALAQDARVAVQSMQQAGQQVSGMAAEFGKTAQRLNAAGGPLEQVAHGAERFSQTTERLQGRTLPSLERAADETARAARQFGRTAADVSETPQSLLYGPGSTAPGPGEPGFTPPTRNPK